MSVYSSQTLRNVTHLASWIVIAGLCALSHGCATTVETAQPLPEVPDLVKVQHPAGLDMMDLQVLFKHAEAPEESARKDCDSDYQKLKGFTANTNEVDAGIYEMVSADPTKYHWCFYTKLLKLHSDLKITGSIREKQNLVLDAFFFLSPVAKSFYTKFTDTRYLRAAIHHYRFLSEWVFYRKLDLTPEMTNQLVTKEIKNPYGFYRPPEEMGTSVLEKYGFIKKEEPAAQPVAQSVPVEPVRATAQAPAAVAAPPVTPAAAPAAAKASAAPEAPSLELFD